MLHFESSISWLSAVADGEQIRNPHIVRWLNVRVNCGWALWLDSHNKGVISTHFWAAKNGVYVPYIWLKSVHSFAVDADAVFCDDEPKQLWSGRMSVQYVAIKNFETNIFILKKKCLIRYFLIFHHQITNQTQHSNRYVFYQSAIINIIPRISNPLI